ncbi:ATP-binding protein [Streptomyces sp. NPDC057638]|uniref:ATP-binding protein n=1 Tax=Streptomyces sp. NPDC057638 TaxID=3346190 RepID=UPI003690F728
MTADASAMGELARLLREARQRAGLSQEELAHASGVSVRALADMERGRSRGPQRRTLRALADALGLEPPEAQRLERAAHRGRARPRTADTRTADTRPADTRTADARPAASGLALPRDLGDFTARGPALAELLTLAADTDRTQPPVVLVCGQPGLGKTSFAVHAAHQLVPRFPDGQFALDLRGMDPRPLPVREALARLLRALGVAEGAIPAGTEERSGLLRSLTGARRLLLLLDNAADEAQVRPLLPGTGTSLTIVTSRQALAGLEAVHRARLGLLRREEGVALLTRIVGLPRVQREAQAARDLVDLCGQLPLAVRIAGQRLAARPEERLSKLVAQLARRGRRLDALSAGELRVRAAFALSYEHLGPGARTLFRRASLAWGPDFSPETAALLADLPLAAAARYAEELTDAGLLHPDPVAERYRFHDLIRLFAAERAAEEDGTGECDAAQDRATHWILRRATAAALRFHADHGAGGSDGDGATSGSDRDREQDHRERDPGRDHQRGARDPRRDTRARDRGGPARTPEGDPDPPSAPADRPSAQLWLEAERAQWLAALHHAHGRGAYRRVLDTARAMHWFSDITQHWEMWAEVFQTSVDAARALGSRPDEAVHLNYLAWAHNVCLRSPATGLTWADAALAVAREIGDGLQEGWGLGYGAGALHRLGRVEESFVRFREAAARLGAEPSGEARLAELTTLNILGSHLRRAGRAEEALAIHERSEAISGAGVPGQSAELVAFYHAFAQQQKGNDLAALGRWGEAEALVRAALLHFDTARALSWTATARLDLAHVLLALGHPEARETLSAAQAALGAVNHPRHAEAVLALSELDGRPPSADDRAPLG